MATARKIEVLSERKIGSGEQFLPVAAFSTWQKANAHATWLNGLNNGTLEFHIEVLTLDPEVAT